jgi:hypothetical protein
LKYGHAKPVLKRNDLSISFTTLNLCLPKSVASVMPLRNEEANRDHVNPEVAWARLRFTMGIV